MTKKWAGVIVGAATMTLLLQAAVPAAGQDAPPSQRFGPWGIDLSSGNPAVAPGDSLFDHANGKWLATDVVPADQTTSGVGADLSNLTAAQLRTIVEKSADVRDDTTTGKIGKLYTSFMDEATIERLDAQPLQPDLARLRAIVDREGMAAFMGASPFSGGTSIWGLGVLPDLKGTKVYTATIGTSGRGLPDRDFYLTDKFKAVRDAYPAHIERTLGMIGWPEPKAAAAAVMSFETAMAEASWTRTEMRDPNKIYHPMTIAELQAYAPEFPWRTWLGAAGAPSSIDRIIVGEDTAIPKIARLYAQTPLSTLTAWQAYHLTAQSSAFLSNRFLANQFAFQRLISGQQQLRPRWFRGIGLVNGAMGEALGEIYVARHFPASSKAAMEELVANLQTAMRLRLRKATWMSPETRAEALLKLDRQMVKVGYPNKWRDYSNLQIQPDDLLGNVRRASAFGFRFNLDRLGQPQDRAEWAMTPQTVNAYFNPLANEIVFPAAMLQPPMFSPTADAAVNYGAIGAVIGHEITHSFDDTGRQFDHTGELRDWWTTADAARFNREATRLAVQYDGYEAIPGTKVNGKLTLGENIGDQGGLSIALDAYHTSLRGRRAPVLNGLTGDQRFFLAWAQSWKKNVKDDTARVLAVSDVHSPARWRVDGTVRNMDAWYAAFGVGPASKLYLKPADRARVW